MKAGRLKPTSTAEQMRRAQQIMRALQQLGRLRADDGGNFVEKRLRARNKRGIRGLRHLPGDQLSPQSSAPSSDRRPARAASLMWKIFSSSMKWFDQPEDTVLAPMAYSSVRSQPMIHAKQFAQRSVGVGVGAAGQRNHGCELGVAEACERASQSGQHERQASVPGRHSALPARPSQRFPRR